MTPPDRAGVKAVDEMVDGRGGVRPHWRGVLAAVSSLDYAVLTERARRLHVGAEPDGDDGSWRCDPVPLPLSTPEFAALEAGLSQRARLLDALVADVYGAQRVLSEGWVPPALLHANPAYLRACLTRPAQAPERTGPMLQTYAADLVRGPDGQWGVLADRTGGALGIGYARECRRMLAQVLPELFRSTQVRQLRPFFESWQDALLRIGARADGRPAVVAMLTPGPADPHWSEHLALSRDLGSALVEARDLTMRGGALAIKTLDGLQTVDVLLRRVPGRTLDPLELSVGGPGVTGLLDAARNGRVQVLNHPGAAVVESFGALLPALAEHMLGEALLLPGCPVAQGGGAWPASLAPCFGPERLEPQPVVLRLFLMHDGTGWRLLQGGMGRVLAPGEAVTETVPAGAVFKDVWVLNEESGFIQGPAPATQAALPVRRSAGNLPSRVAEDLYWLGRRVERLDGQARVGRAGLLRRARGAPLPREIAELQVLTRCLRAAGLETEESRMPLDDQVRESLRPGGSIDKGLHAAARLIEALRDRMTIETHGAFTHAMRAARADVADAPGDGIDGLVHAMSGLQRLATTVSGVSAEGMVRGGGRLFLELGRRVERAMVVGKVLGTALDQPPARLDGTLRLVLELSDSVITYRSRYLSVLQAVPVLDLVLIDPGNPRSLAFQFAEAAALLDQAGDPELAGAARDWVRRLQDLMDRVARGEDVAGAVTEAGVRLVEIGEAASALSERITRRFFALLPRLQSVGLEVA